MFAFEDLFDFGFNITNQNYNVTRLALITNYLLLFILIFFSIINFFIKHNVILASVEVFFSLLSLAGVIYYKISKNTKNFLLWTTSIIFGVSIVFYVYIEKVLFASVWLFFFPLVVFLLNGLQIGKRFVIAYLIVIVGYTYGGIGEYTDTIGFLHLALALSIFTFFVYQFEKSRKEAFSKHISLMQKLENLSQTDALTTLYNRHFLHEYIIQNKDLTNKPFVFCISDIDNFKRFNDLYGHQKGDEILRKIARLKQACLQNDENKSFVIRLGGEEFGAFLFNQNDFQSRLECFLQAVEALAIKHKGNAPYNVCTVSVGAVISSNTKEFNFSRIYQIADQALYEAKKSGKNRIVYKTLN